MRGARETGAVAADSDLNLIKYPLSNITVFDKFLGDIADSLIHGQIVMIGSHNQIDLAYHATGIDKIVVYECSSGELRLFPLPIH